jgi:hypothetical protein
MKQLQLCVCVQDTVRMLLSSVMPEEDYSRPVSKNFKLLYTNKRRLQV